MKKAGLRAVVVLVATVVALPVAAAPGQWRYQGYRIEPDPATLPKGMPIRQISGGLQVKPTTSVSVSMGFTNEDVEKVRCTTSLPLGFQLNAGRPLDARLEHTLGVARSARSPGPEQWRGTDRGMGRVNSFAGQSLPFSAELCQRQTHMRSRSRGDAGVPGRTANARVSGIFSAQTCQEE